MKIELKKCVSTLLILLAFFPCFHAKAQPNQQMDLFFKLSDYYFSKYVYKGMVDYRYASSYSKEIDALYNLIGEVDLTSASKNEKMAFCINAYNLLVIYQVAKSYPIGNPLDQDGFFDKNPHKVAGREITLNQLEIDHMLRKFEDSRFHFVLACAAKSCPRLADFAYKPENVESLLEKRTKMTLNDDTFIRVIDGSSKVQISKIFEWYAGDFKNADSILEYINNFRDEKIPTNYAIEYYEYDWNLNEKKS
ncbi:MAG: DUF547 domain-containing protein [Cyclobacteriaceae bacterium]